MPAGRIRANPATTIRHPQRRNRRRAGPQPSSNVPPKRPSGPRITSKPNRPRKPSNGSKIFIGVVLALAIVIGLFFALAQFVTDVMWYSQLGFQSVIWTQLEHRVRPLAGVRGAHRRSRLRLRHAGDMGASRRCGRLHHPRVNGDTIEIGKSVSSKSARRIAVVISLIVGLVFGSQFNANWSEILLMFNSQSFGTKDPQFGIDNGCVRASRTGNSSCPLSRCCCSLASSSPSSPTCLWAASASTMPVNGHGLFHILQKHACARSASG